MQKEGILLRTLHKYRPAIAAFLLMIAVSITSTAISFMNQPVSQDLGVGLGSFTLYCSICGITGAVAMTFVGQWLGKYGLKRILIITAFWTGIGLLLYSFANSLWMFYLVGAYTGVLCGSALTLCANVMVQTYYNSKDAASLLGIVMAGTGVGGMLFSAVMPGLLEQFGWRWGYRVMGISWITIVLLAVIILGNAAPAAQEGKGIQGSSGMTRAEALRSPILYLAVTAMLLLAFGTGVSQHIPTILATNGFTTAQIAAMMSFYTAMLALGKIGQGFLYAKAGLVKGGIITHIITIAGFLLLGVTVAVYPALAMLAVGMGIASTLFPLLCKTLFGQKEYAQIYSIITTALTAGAFLSTPIWGFVYDWTGSYVLGFVIMSVLMAVSFVCQIAALRISKKTAAK